MSRIKADVLSGSIKSHMFRLAIPSIGGMFAVTVFNLTDTFFVSRLGTQALAAMGFTFPIIMIIGSLSGGLSLGAGSILARALGSGNDHKMHRIATDGILLSILAVFIISIAGYFTVEPFFYLMGARNESLELVSTYMRIWYAGAFVIVVPPVSDSSMRALGDMTRPFLVMLTCAVMNMILDPILIFGLFGLPEMGISGAALATIISRAFGMVLSLSFVHFHYKLIDFNYDSFTELFKSWGEILSIGLPNVVVRILPQLTRAMMTRLASSMAMGSLAVAALAAGQRIESFATIVSMAIGVSIVPIIGQNFGAGHYHRVRETRNLVIRISLVYGLCFFIIALPLGPILASIFTKEPEVIKLTTTYIRIMMIGTIGLNHYNWLSESFNAVGKPRFAIFINALGTLMIILPGLFIGSSLYAFKGMLLGLVTGQLLVGGLAIYLSKNHLAKDQ